MAIKGKSRSKSTKAVTRGPKPAYVPVKQPFLARRGLWIGVASVLGVLVLVGLGAGFVAQRNSDREEALLEEMASSIGVYGDQLDPILAAVGKPVPPSGFEAFPALTPAVEQLEGDSAEAPADARAIVVTSSDAVDAATSAIDALQGIDETELIRGKGFSEEFVVYVINSKGNLLRSMRLFVEAGELTKAAAQAHGADRAILLARARGVLNVAAEVFSRGYADLVEAQTKAGVFEPSSVGAPPIPTGS